MSKRGHGEGTIYQRADGLWVAGVTTGYEDGKQKRRYVYGKTRTIVREKLDTLRTQQTQGPLPRAHKYTVSAFLAVWLEHMRHRWSARTHELATYEAAHYVTPHVGSRPLKKLEPIDVERLQGLIAKRHGKRTANKARGLLYQALQHAVKLRLVPANVAQAVDPIPIRRPAVEPVPRHDLRAFLAAAEGSRFYALFYLAVAVGLRRGELLGLRWRDVTDTHITVAGGLKVVKNRPQVGETKTAKGARRHPISPSACAVLAEHRRRQEEERAVEPGWQDHGLVFPNTLGKPQSPHNLYKREFLRIQEAAGLRRADGPSAFTLHQLRHTYATLMIEQGMDPKLLSERLGHARASFTMDTYVHAFEERRESAAVPLEDLLAGGRDPN